MIHYARPLTSLGEPLANGSFVPLGKRLGVPLPFYILHDVSLIKAHLISLEIPAYVGENIPKLVHLDNGHVLKHELEFVIVVKTKLVMTG